MAEDLQQKVAYIEAASEEFGRRLTGVERHVQTLQNDMNAGFSALSSKLDKLDARPTFNVHETIRTVQSLGLTVGLVVGAIIWIVNGSFSGMIARQDATNISVQDKLKEHSAVLHALGDRVQWTAKIEPAPRRN